MPNQVRDALTRLYRHLSGCRACFGVVHLRWPAAGAIPCRTGRRLRLAFERLAFRWDEEEEEEEPPGIR